MNSYLEGRSGVGGWLGFFVVALGLFSPGAGLVQASRSAFESFGGTSGSGTQSGTGQESSRGDSFEESDKSRI
jgi:hypothetical protein